MVIGFRGEKKLIRFEAKVNFIDGVKYGTTTGYVPGTPGI
jgi:hypothetical protein